MKLSKVIYDVTTNKAVPIDLDKIIKGRALFQANSGGGKSYLLRRFLEQSHGHVQQIIIDPEGEFHSLREKYEYLLIGKDNADIQIDTRHAPLMARKLMETNANAILDLYEMSHFERIRFVKVFLDALVNLPKSLWHPAIIVIDEIHVFAPESSKGRSESLESVASLASRGRKRGYALVGATQKLSKFHKDVASELNTKFTGRCTLDIDQKRAAQDLGIKHHTELRNLDYEFHAYGPAIDSEVKIKSYPVDTTHADIGIVKYTIANPNKIRSLLANFAELPQEAENELKTTDDLKRKIQEQKNEIIQLKKGNTGNDRLKETESQYKQLIFKKDSIIKSQKELLDQTQRNLEIYAENVTAQAQNIYTKTVAIGENPKPILVTQRATQETLHPKVTESTSDLGKCASACLMALAERGRPSTMKQIAVFSGYSSRSGGFRNAIYNLRTAGLLSGSGDSLTITDAGLAKVGHYTEISNDPADILQAWSRKLGVCSTKILEYVCGIYPGKTTKDDIANKTGYSVTSGGFRNSIYKLGTLDLLIKDGDNFSASQEEMFP